MTNFDTAFRGTGRLLVLLIVAAAVAAIAMPAEVAQAQVFSSRVVVTAGGFYYVRLEPCGGDADCDTAAGETCEAFYPSVPGEMRLTCVNVRTTPIACDSAEQCPLPESGAAAGCMPLPGLEGTSYVGVCIYNSDRWCPEAGVLEPSDIRQCLTFAGAPVETFLAGDCDGDGIINGNEEDDRLCLDDSVRDAGIPPADGGADASTPSDGGVVGEDAGTIDGGRDAGGGDSGTGPDDDGGGTVPPDDTDGGARGPTEESSFRGAGGCTCDASAPLDQGSSFALAALVGVALFRRRRR